MKPVTPVSTSTSPSIVTQLITTTVPTRHIYIAAEGPKSMKFAGVYGDGLITDSQRAVKPEMREAIEEGAHESGKDPKAMPILAEHFVIVGITEVYVHSGQVDQMRMINFYGKEVLPYLSRAN